MFQERRGACLIPVVLFSAASSGSRSTSSSEMPSSVNSIRRLATRCLSGAQPVRKIVQGNHAVLVQHERTFDHVLQFADVFPGQL